MGRDITLYPKKATRKELRSHLENLGFVRCGHLWDWPRGTLNFHWFDHIDFKSIDGVSADIYPVADDELPGIENRWALHVRNLHSASWHDVHMLNEVLRSARRKFGGTLEGDYGKNRYAPLWEDYSTPISRGIALVFQEVAQEVSAVKFALPKASFEHQAPEGSGVQDLLDFTNSLDPSRVIYNGLVPFAVAIFECFFSRSFQVLIAHDEFALKKRESHSSKVEFSTLVELDQQRTTIERIIASRYSFQNINQLNRAYKEWLNIDVRNILYRKKRIGRSIRFLEHRLAEIIQSRHGIVHHFAIDRSLTREGLLETLDVIEKAIKEFVGFLEKKYGVEIERV